MSDQLVKCPHCHETFPLSEILTHELEVKVEEEFARKLAEKTREVKAKAKEEARKDLETELKDKANESEELQKRNREMTDKLLELNKTLREMQRAGEDRELEMQKRLLSAQERIKEESQKRADEEFRLKLAEMQKKLDDARTANDDLRRKLEQGSQQTQGEVQELILEDLLKGEFPQDTINPVAKGVRGGDVLQTVFDKTGRECGRILWESKQTKTWSHDWAGKLKEDQRQSGADIAILISAVLPPKIENLGYHEGIWVTNLGSALGACWILRYHLILAAGIKKSAAVTGEKKDELYEYVTGLQFQHRVEAMMDAYTQLLEDMEKEKRWFTSKWAKQEKSIRTLMEQTGSIHGELSGIIGPGLPGIKNLEIETDEELSLSLN